MSTLAIKGHATRGSEVIELLEMLGGENRYFLDANNTKGYYFINDDCIICTIRFDFTIFTLEQFLEKYPCKVGDTLVDNHNLVRTVERMFLDGDKVEYVLSPLTVHTTNIFETTINEKATVTFDCEVNGDDYIFKIPEGQELVEMSGKWILRNKQPQYPKAYEECCNILNHNNEEDYVGGYEDNLLGNLQILLICRDAYWKIEGDWKYDVNKTEDYYYIVNKCGRVVKEHYMNFNHILAFPTAEMRDAFYENFKELIDSCKELL